MRGSRDLVLSLQTGEYEEDEDGNSSVDEGDWNGDGDFNTRDFVLAFQTGHYVAAARPVPSKLAAAADLLFAEYI